MSPKIPEPLQQIFNVFQALKAFDSTKVLKIEAVEEFLQTAIGKRVVSERKCKFALFEISGPESEGAFRSAEFEPEFSSKSTIVSEGAIVPKQTTTQSKSGQEPRSEFGIKQPPGDIVDPGVQLRCFVRGYRTRLQEIVDHFVHRSRPVAGIGIGGTAFERVRKYLRIETQDLSHPLNHIATRAQRTQAKRRGNQARKQRIICRSGAVGHPGGKAVGFSLFDKPALD